MAIGASFGNIAGDVIGRGLMLIGAGLAIGCTMTVLLLRRYGKLLGVNEVADPAALAGACAVLLLAGILASLIPAWRAGRTNPVEMLRLDS